VYGAVVWLGYVVELHQFEVVFVFV